MKVFNKVLAFISIGALLAASAFAQKPTLFFSDITSGPSTGGENGNGALVTIYGNNLGSNPSVALGSTPGIIKATTSSYLWYQRLTLQIPSTVQQGAMSISVANPNGSSNTLPFTVRAGKIVMVTSASQLLSVRSSWVAGDIYYLQGTWAQSADDGNGWRSSFSIFGPSGQNYAQGTAAAPIAIVGYPGSNVTIGGGADFGIRGDRSYITVANVALRGNQTSANPQWSNGLRYIANDISAPTTHVQMGCWSSNSVTDVKFLGNNVHNCGTSSSDKQDHAVYFSTDVNSVEEAWNSIHDNQTCYGTQFHSSPITAGSGNNQYDLHVHDNQFYNQVCSAVNFATVDPSKGTVEMYNNLVYNTGTSGALSGGGGAVGCLYLAGIANTGVPGSGTVQVYNNTFYKCGPTFLTDNDSVHPVSLKNNIIQMTFGTYTTMNAGTFSGSSNLWFGAGSAPSQTAGNIGADAKFLNAAGVDFHLVTGSPAINAGSANSLIYDIDGIARATGSAIDLGAFASSAATVNPTPDLTVGLSHTGNFLAGDTGKTYTISVANTGSASTNLSATVADSLPGPMTATSISGTGWSCALGTLTCNRNDALAAGLSYPAITLMVNVDSSASGTLTNAVSVGGGGESNTSNDTGTDPTSITAASLGADLTVNEAHAGNFTQGQIAATNTITVTNSGGSATSGTVTAVASLPSGLTATALNGTGWSCALATLTCIRNDSLPAGLSYPSVILTFNVAANAAASVKDSASVSGGSEVVTSNDTDTDPITISPSTIGGADLTISQSPTTSFRQGQTGATVSVSVTNSGTATTSGAVTVSDTLPTALTATSIGGSGWNCILSLLTCNRTDGLSGGTSYPAITITVNVSTTASYSQSINATVSGGSEVNTSNDTNALSISVRRRWRY